MSAKFLPTESERKRMLELYEWFSKFSPYDRLRIAYRARVQAGLLRRLGNERLRKKH
ncbi:MAG: hypothetical protein RDV41_07585 [Planctomycetota bacterium]|nr:hypothetical protein [Planctomycetota bacterium]